MEADALRGIRYADPRRGAITVREYAETVFLPSMLHLRPNSSGTGKHNDRITTGQSATGG